MVTVSNSVSIIIFLSLGSIAILLFFLIDSNTRRILPDQCVNVAPGLAVIPGVSSTTICSTCPITGCNETASNLSEAKTKSMSYGCTVFSYDNKGNVMYLSDTAITTNVPAINSDIYYFIVSK